MKRIVAAVLFGSLGFGFVARGGEGERIISTALRGAVGAGQSADVAFVASTHLGRAPLTVEFDARRARVPIGPFIAGPIAPAASRAVQPSVRYLWDFGDGALGAGKFASHTYTAPGQYEVTLMYMTASGTFASIPFVVSVSDGSFDLNAPVSENEARRFLWQAAFGPKPADIAFIVASGYEAWIDAQLALPPTEILPADLQTSIDLGYGYGPDSLWDDLCIEAPDQLRQRLAWALLQVLVMNNPQDTAAADSLYFSQYINQSLGNYRDLLSYVTRSHQMGTFLTYIDNVKADPATGSVPDENYAREVLQLFSIGLWMLNPDGTRVLDGDHNPIASYDNTTVQQFARIFTGFRWASDFSLPMVMSASRHEFGAKQLLNYPGAIPPNGFIPAITVPAQQTAAAALADVDAALDNIFHHPNCAPFISDLLIKRLVTSNPTPAYVRRVAEAFEGGGPYGSGVRGDLLATAKAILLDEEARDPAYRANPLYGKVKEPMVTRWALYRILERVDRPTERFPFRINADPYNSQLEFGQSFMGSPSVFNFYLPNYIPPQTDLASFERYAPELQVYNDFTALATQNRLHDELVVRGGAAESPRYNEWRALSGAPAFLVDALNNELMHGTMTTYSRQTIIAALVRLQGETDRVRSAVWLVVNSPEFRVLK